MNIWGSQITCFHTKSVSNATLSPVVNWSWVDNQSIQCVFKWITSESPVPSTADRHNGVNINA